jgi:hypothetical protein
VLVVNELEKKYGTQKIVAIVSDRGSNYLSARNTISINSSILSVNCAAHLLNLLAGDITKLPSLQHFILRAKAIIKEIKGSKVKLGEYNEEFDRWIQEEKRNGREPERKVSLTLPSVTRWFEIRDMLSKLRRAKPILLRLSIREGCDLTFSTRDSVLAESFWNMLGNVHPLFIAITDGNCYFSVNLLLRVYCN